jgi:hypothetical protein
MYPSGASSSFFGTKLHQISTWKIWFQPIKGYFMEKMAQIHQISKKKNSKSPDFYDKFQ